MGDAPGTPGIEERVRAAYIELAGGRGIWVGLAELREVLGDLPRAEVDAELARMERMPEVSLVPESNQKRLTAQDREAAVVIGDQAKHLLWIGTQ